MQVADDPRFGWQIIKLGIGVCRGAWSNEINHCSELALWDRLPDLRTQEWQWMLGSIAGWSSSFRLWCTCGVQLWNGAGG